MRSEASFPPSCRARGAIDDAAASTGTPSSIILHLFNGRGLNEAVYGETQTFAGLDYQPCHDHAANELFTLSTMLAHNKTVTWELDGQPMGELEGVGIGCQIDDETPRGLALFGLLVLGLLAWRRPGSP